MKRTTIFADEELLSEIREISVEEKKSVAEVMREAMQSYVRKKKPASRKLSFVGVARSGTKDIAERHEELLWKRNSS
jgi:metal-responsive CopG/Arc/MetJ family transcriptional regulator